eukprot:252663-Amphidinium_carterae.6
MEHVDRYAGTSGLGSEVKLAKRRQGLTFVATLREHQCLFGLQVGKQGIHLVVKAFLNSQLPSSLLVSRERDEKLSPNPDEVSS